MNGIYNKMNAHLMKQPGKSTNLMKQILLLPFLLIGFVLAFIFCGLESDKDKAAEYR
jgi:hypothetical protein